VVGYLGLVAGLPHKGYAQTDPLVDLDDYVRRVMRDWEAPGIAVAVVKDDRVVLARGWGVRELGGSIPVDDETIFAIASTSKAFTAAALGMLVDAGRLHWDDRVIDHLPDFRLFDPYVTREMTVRDLLSHRSGLRRGDLLWYASPFERDEVIHRLRELRPSWSFRARYGYQNIMFTTAGEIVEAVTDTTWDQFVSRRIFDPLGMLHSTTSIRELDGRTNVATPHGRIDGEVMPIPWRNFDNLGGAGAINSSAADLAQWMRLQLSEGTYQGTCLLSDSVIKEMHTPQTVVRRSAQDEEMFPESHFAAYGLGWRLMDYRGRLIVRHGGALDGMRTHVLLVPKEELGVVAIANVNEGRIPQAIVWHVVDAYLGPRDKDWSEVYLAAAQEARDRADSARERREHERVSGTTPTHPLGDYAGTYLSELYGTAVVELADGHLVVRVGPYFVGDLAHWHYNTFRTTWRDRYLGEDFVSFDVDRRGTVAAVEVQGFGRFQRQAPPATSPSGP
jgi:CubicO group peptidase (beta-lactamase class C family)